MVVISHVIVKSFFIIAAIIYQSCARALRHNNMIEEYYNIRHKNMLSFAVVQCKIVSDKIMALIHHDSEKKISVHGYDNPGSFR